MLFAMLLALAALADPGYAPGYEDVLVAAQRLEADGKHEAARSLAGWVAERPDATQELRDLAAAALRTFPEARAPSGPKLRLVLWETLAGAWILGPNLAFNEALGDEAPPYFAGALLGGAAGFFGGLALAGGEREGGRSPPLEKMARAPKFDAGRADAMIGAQQLGAFNGAVLLAQADEYTGPPWGIAFGFLGGTAAGFAGANGPEAASAAFRAGSFWGVGLTTVALAYTYAAADMDEGTVPLVLAAGADVGALAGIGLAHALPLRRDQVRLFNIGGIVGASTAYGFAWMTSEIVWYTPHAVAAIVGGAGLTGGALGVLLANRLERPRVREPHERRLPLPYLGPWMAAGPDPAWGVQLSGTSF